MFFRSHRWWCWLVTARKKIQRESWQAVGQQLAQASIGNLRFLNYLSHLTNHCSQIWTSELRRTINTVKNIPGQRTALKDLNEINAGICEGLTYEEIQERYPSEFAWRDQDKLKYRYPHGESYLDLLQRVDGVVQALLLNTAVLVVSHQAVLRCIMAYFKGSKPGK